MPRDDARDRAAALISGSKLRVLEAAGLRVAWADDLEAYEALAMRAEVDVPRLLEASIELNELRARVARGGT